jgi:hypothetical protein
MLANMQSRISGQVATMEEKLNGQKCWPENLRGRYNLEVIRG